MLMATTVVTPEAITEATTTLATERTIPELFSVLQEIHQADTTPTRGLRRPEKLMVDSTRLVLSTSVFCSTVSSAVISVLSTCPKSTVNSSDPLDALAIKAKTTTTLFIYTVDKNSTSQKYAIQTHF